MKSIKVIILVLLSSSVIFSQQNNDTIKIIESEPIPITDRINNDQIIKKEHFNKGIIFSPLQLVESRVPGFNFNCINGNDPSPIFDFQIRGISNLMSKSNPLFVVDDVPVNNIDFISPENIESIELLNSPVQTSQYGYWGFDGVVKINTKKPIKKDLSIEFKTNTYIEFIKYQFMSSEQWRSVFDYWKSNEFIYEDDYIFDYGSNTNWVKEVSQHKLNQSFNLGLNKSIKNTHLISNLSYDNLHGALQKNDRTNYNAFFKIEQTALEEKIKMDISWTGNYRKFSQINNNSLLNSSIKSIFTSFHPYFSYIEQYNPTVKSDSENGNYDFDSLTYYAPVSPLEILDKTKDENIRKDNLLQFNFNYRLYKGLTFKINYALVKSTKNGKFLLDSIFNSNTKLLKYAGHSNSNFYLNEQIFKPGLSYKLNLNKHILWADLRIHYLLSNHKYLGNARIVSPFNSLAYEGYRIVSEEITNLNPCLKYSFNKVLNISGSYNREFVKNSLIKKHPDLQHFSGEMNISLKKIYPISKINTISDIILTLSLGSLERLNYMYINDKDSINEQVKDINIGGLIKLFSDNFSLKINHYNKNNTNTYNFKPANPSTGHYGFYYPLNIKNKGWEIQLKCKYEFGQVKFYNELLFSFNTNMQLVSDKKIAPTNIDSMPTGNIYGNKLAGYNENLRPLFYDLSGNIVKNYSLSNNVLLGNGSPKSFIGFFSMLNYKNIEFSFLIKGATNYQIVNEEMRFGYRNNFRKNFDKIYDVITPYRTDYFVHNGDYLLLDNVAISYTIPFKKGKIKSIKVDLSGNNLFYILNKTGIEPEIIEISGNNPGHFYGKNYPKTTLVQLGLSAKL